MNTEAHGTLVRLTVAIRGGSNPARAPLKVIRVWEFAAAMKQPNELVNPTSPMNQSNQRLKCRDRSRKGAASLKLPRKLTPVTASANVRPTRPRNPPGEPPLAWNGALRWFPCTRLGTTIDKMISPSASLQNIMNEARAEMTTPRSVEDGVWNRLSGRRDSRGAGVGAEGFLDGRHGAASCLLPVLGRVSAGLTREGNSGPHESTPCPCAVPQPRLAACPGTA